MVREIKHNITLLSASAFGDIYSETFARSPPQKKEDKTTYSYSRFLKVKSERKDFTFNTLSVNKLCPNSQGTTSGRHQPMLLCSPYFKLSLGISIITEDLGTSGVKH